MSTLRDVSRGLETPASRTRGSPRSKDKKGKRAWYKLLDAPVLTLDVTVWGYHSNGSFVFPLPDPRVARPDPRIHKVIWRRGATREEDAQGKATQSHTSPIILVYEDV